MSAYIEICQEFIPNYLERPWSAKDGIPEKEIKKAETRLGFALPTALRNFYLAAGRATDLCIIHNLVFQPKELVFEEGHLIFMDENQSVVSWGIKKKDLAKPNPIVWQRNNSTEKWYSEKKDIIKLFVSMFDWYKEIGVWK